jgi:HD-GYP domain-containing protein (c-di-GMP phosphodiesterase class II)
MLKKIRVDQLEVGMHLHELCGSWLDHPFWSRRLTLRNRADLDKLRASGIVECWIDASKGRDVAANDNDGEPVEAMAAIGPAVPDDEPAGSVSSGPAPVPIEREAVRAAALCLRSKKAVEALFTDARMGRALSTDECLPLVDDIASSIWRHPGALISLARLKTHDDYSYMHSVAVCALMVVLGKQLGLDEVRCREAGLAGLLHDIGKSMMPLAILNKPGRLTTEEYAVMRTHPERGLELLADANRVSGVVLDVCGHHHERPDGRGYPHGLSGEALSLHARMGAVCDVYDAITSNRPYKDGWDPAESIARMTEWTAAGQFDPDIFRAFVDSIGIYPVGSLVRLQSGRLAVVTEQNPASALKPRVTVFFSIRAQLPIAPAVVDLARPNCHDLIVGRESNEKWKFPHLSDLLAGYEVLRQGATAPRR